MFTGIIEQLGQIVRMEEEGTNVHVTVKAPFTNELKIDQSVAHSGVCLTVVNLHPDDQYTVTAIKQTLDVSALKSWKVGSKVNLERCMQMNGRLDGHIVQGHVDSTAFLEEIKNEDGSWKFVFRFRDGDSDMIVDKGSITVNGISLTLAEVKKDGFTVAIIPYTYEHTNFHSLKVGDEVNIEFDIIGKYVKRMMAAHS
tara:strand:- start:134 stop:727 length:594 start_codon:yes stop_codon:yes gene_type:complete